MKRVTGTHKSRNHGPFDVVLSLYSLSFFTCQIIADYRNDKFQPYFAFRSDYDFQKYHDLTITASVAHGKCVSSMHGGSIQTFLKYKIDSSGAVLVLGGLTVQTNSLWQPCRSLYSHKPKPSTIKTTLHSDAPSSNN